MKDADDDGRVQPRVVVYQDVPEADHPRERVAKLAWKQAVPRRESRRTRRRSPEREAAGRQQRGRQRPCTSQSRGAGVRSTTRCVFQSCWYAGRSISRYGSSCSRYVSRSARRRRTRSRSTTRIPLRQQAVLANPEILEHSHMQRLVAVTDMRISIEQHPAAQ